jgi:UDP-N-acetylglucosamine 4,6-dehydratase
MQSVLITGGTGSFGQAFAKHLLNYNLAERICIYSRSEHVQAAMRHRFADDERLRWFIGDVRDRARLARAMHGVDTVVHAAALKRIEVGQYNPSEMVKTNVQGAMNVIDTATMNGVENVIALSTDKACAPISPYGQSKALAESLFLSANVESASRTRFAVTRYGNVWASAGSVVPKWRELINRGADSVPVTDPECTRFFMTIEQAVALVLNAYVRMPNALVIPRELSAYRLGDLVEAMGVKANVIGLPAWEKKHEYMDYDLCSADARRMSVDELRQALQHA